MELADRIELSFLGYKASVLPFDDASMELEIRIELIPRLYESRVLPIELFKQTAAALPSGAGYIKAYCL